MAPLAPSVAGSRDSYSVGAAAIGAGEGLHAGLGAGSSLGLHTIVEGALVSLSRLAAGTLAGAGCSVGVILTLNEGLTAGVISNGGTVVVGMTQSGLGLLSVGVAAVLTGVSGDLRLISSLVLGYLRSKVTGLGLRVRSVLAANAGMGGTSLCSCSVMLPLAPSVAGSGDNHVILADHIAAIRAAGGHGLGTVLLAGGIHNVAFQSLRIMRRGGQLSSEGGVCGDGRRGGIGIPSIAVVAGSIGSLSGQSRYRSGALALFHFLGAQRSAVLGHIINGVRLGLRSAVASDLQSTSGINGSGLINLAGERPQAVGVVRTHVVGGQVGVLIEGQQIIGNNRTSCNLEAKSTQIQAIQLNAQLIIAAQRTALLKGVGITNINNRAFGRQFRMCNTQVIRSITILTTTIDQIGVTICITNFRLSGEHTTVTGGKAFGGSLTHFQRVSPFERQLAVTKLTAGVLQNERCGYIIFAALNSRCRKIGAVRSLTGQVNLGKVCNSIVVSRVLPFLITIGDEVLVIPVVSSPYDINLRSNISCRNIVRCIYILTDFVICCQGGDGSHGDDHQTSHYTGKKLLCAFTHKTFPPKLIVFVTER